MVAVRGDQDVHESSPYYVLAGSAAGFPWALASLVLGDRATRRMPVEPGGMHSGRCWAGQRHASGLTRVSL